MDDIEYEDDDHNVPADLVELYEVLEWAAAHGAGMFNTEHVDDDFDGLYPQEADE